MGEELPDGTMQGYSTICPKCNAEVKCNMQGKIYGHDCLVCGEEAPLYEAPKGTFCNREKGHPGEHCRNRLDVMGYRNIWWKSA